MRQVVGLQRAVPCARPQWMARRRPRGSKGLGLRYEAALARALPSALHNPWYEYLDANGPGWASPDILTKYRGHVVVLECKLTDIAAAEAQLQELYFPIVELVYGLPAKGIVVVRSLVTRPDPSRVVTSLAAALAAPGVPIWHWLGAGAPL